MSEFIFKQECHKIVGCAMEVLNAIGRGTHDATRLRAVDRGDLKPQMDANKRKCKFSFFINVHLRLKNNHTPEVAILKIWQLKQKPFTSSTLEHILPLN